MNGFEPGNECALCKGRCCREKGCCLCPDDMIKALQNWQMQATHLSGQPVADCQEQGTTQTTAIKEVDVCDGMDLSLPKRIHLAEEKLLPFLAEEGNLYTIDCFYAPTGPLYYLRMRHKNYTFIGVDAIGECIALTKEGCSLSMEKRPKGGRFLESKPDGHCIQHYSKEQMTEDWLPYQKILKSIWDEYYNRFMEDGTFDRCDEANFAWMRAQREGH
ncbi:MAG: hypothetical protein IJ405_07350 [Lachnospiraceae bacterium]|nr:hypothetical protein [Lachnospiraceae bacterium]